MALISYQLKTMNIFRQQSRQQSDRTMVINVRISSRNWIILNYDGRV